jgi:subtilisin family serine protease
VALVVALLAALAPATGSTTSGAEPSPAAAEVDVLPQAPPPQAEPLVDRAILTLAPGADGAQVAQDVVEEARSLGAEDAAAVPLGDGDQALVLDGVPTEVQAQLRRNTQVRDVAPDLPLYPALAQTTVKVGADRTKVEGYTGVGQTIAVIDTGVAAAHPALVGAVVHEICFVDIQLGGCPNGTDRDDDPGAAAPPCGGDQGLCWHGTHVAGTAAGRPHAGQPGGVAPDASIVAIRVFAEDGKASSIDLLRALYWLNDEAGAFGVDVVNLSIASKDLYSGHCDSASGLLTAIRDEVALLRTKGTLVVAATGNADPGAVGKSAAPACVSNIAGVSATTLSDTRAGFAHVSSTTALFAPGENVKAPIPGGGYGTMSGTSMAAPHVAGAVAVLRQIRSVSPSVVLSVLRATGRPISTPVGTIPRLDVWAASQAPLAPPSATATHGDRRATVSWAAASPGIGGPITGYRITVKPGGAQRTVSASTRSTTFTGLTNGTRYQLEVRALNTDGAGAVRTSNLVIPKPPPPPHGFVDVAAGAYYDQPVRWLKREGITTGVGGTNRFQPDAGVTRGQMATFLWRLMGTPSVSTAHGFVDVSSSAYYDPAVRWLKAAGITTGVGGTNRFEPNQIVTRDQMAAFLWRLVKSPAGYPAHGLVDVPSGAFYDAAVRWLKATGITTGVGGTNRYEPRSPVTRGQMAAFLHRLARNPAAWVKVPVGQIPNTIVF